MRRVLRHIPALIILVMIISVSCRKQDAEVIPRAKLSRIYAEMLMTDQWVMSAKGVRLIADTSLVYEPILEKYGYTTEDYVKTVDVYMNDPERFAKVLRTTVDILDERLVQLRKEKHAQEVKAAKEREWKKMADLLKSDFDPAEYFPYLNGEPYVHYYDSVSFEPDSALWVYRLISIERADTIYDRIRMIVKTDTLSVCDSMPTKDTVVTVGPLMKMEPELKVQGNLQTRRLDGQIRRRIIEDVEK
ncbi:MAG: DUF4296 domain-containing protein [Bacteroidales bacterium]|nr:DUF4296 domain-containing protein [Bacteroidales bacterium]